MSTMTREEAAALFGLFVSAVEGHHVPRYGKAGIIGGKRPVIPPAERKGWRQGGRGVMGPVVLDTTAIVGITRTECETYGREYARAISKGALRSRSIDEWLAAQEES